MSKHRILSVVLSSVLPILLTLAVNTAVQYHYQSDALISISRPLAAGTSRLVIIQVRNMSRSFLNGIVMEVPDRTPQQSITSSRPLQLTPLKDTGSSNRKRIRLDDIAPYADTNILVPVDSSATDEEVIVINSSQSNVEMIEQDVNSSSLRRALQAVALDTSVYAIVFLSVAFYFERAQANRSARSDASHSDLRKSIEDLQQSGKVSEERLKAVNKELQTRLARLRMYASSQVSSYSKELDFWRDTIRKVLYDTGASDKQIDSVLKGVSKTLETYSTQGKAPGLGKELASIQEYYLGNEKES